MLIRAAADLHGHLSDIQACDILLLAGDLVPVDKEDSEQESLRWLATDFAAWLDQVPAEHVIGIAGNHDRWALTDSPLPTNLRWSYLSDSKATVRVGEEPMRIYGSSWTPTWGGWAFEATASQQRFVAGLIPTGIDILVLHSPPWGMGDRAHRSDVLGRGFSSENVGSRAYRAAIERAQPSLCVYGHIHDDAGWRGQLGRTLCANVSVRDHLYQVSRAPAAFIAERDHDHQLRVREV